MSPNRYPSMTLSQLAQSLSLTSQPETQYNKLNVGARARTASASSVDEF